jgi:hypothetical protein
VLGALAGRLADSANALVAASDVVVVGHATTEFREAVARRTPGAAVVDLVRLFKKTGSAGDWQGIAW